VLLGDRLLITSATAGVSLLTDASARFGTKRVTVRPEEKLSPELAKRTPPVVGEDLQDVAGDGAVSAYLITSHARTPRGESRDERYRLLRLQWDAWGKLENAQHSGALLQAIVAGVPFLADAIRRPPARAGLSIEGLAWSPEGELVVGFRAPTVTESTPREHGAQEDAVVVRIQNPAALFGTPPQPAQLSEVVKLDLRGMGLRGMAAATSQGKAGYWLLAGLSVAPNHPVKSPWALWWWDGANAPRRVELPAAAQMLETPTAVCPLTVGGEGRLLLISPGGSTESRFVLLPTPAL
jgi:hypothetical protein